LDQTKVPASDASDRVDHGSVDMLVVRQVEASCTH
jgi:hypothetical protein